MSTATPKGLAGLHKRACWQPLGATLDLPVRNNVAGVNRKILTTEGQPLQRGPYLSPLSSDDPLDALVDYRADG